jgi:hypothetical protein
MRAVPKPQEQPAAPEVQDVHDAAARLREAEGRVTALNKRLDAIEARAMVVLAERSRHQSAVTAALLESHELPAALPPQPVEPGEAVRIVKAELKNAEQALETARLGHRDAVVHLFRHRREEALAEYKAGFAQFTERLRALAAYDKLGARVLEPALPISSSRVCPSPLSRARTT